MLGNNGGVFHLPLFFSKVFQLGYSLVNKMEVDKLSDDMHVFQKTSS